MMRYLLALLLTSPAMGQYDAYARRALRERAVAWTGVESRAFVETGDDAARALLSCSQHGAKRLVEFHKSGALDRLPQPALLLRCIAIHGDAVLLFAMQNQDKLADADCFTAYVSAPAEFALGLRDLDQGGAEVRARKLAYYAAANRPRDWKRIGLWGGGFAIAGLLLWRYRRKH